MLNSCPHYIVTAYCALHNICKVHNNTFDHQGLMMKWGKQASWQEVQVPSTAAFIQNALCDNIDKSVVH